MKITITGGSGFIGTQLAYYLKKKGHQFLIADVKEPSIDLRNYYHFCDITDPYQVQDVIEGQDLVFHLAANPNPGRAENNPRWDLRINVEGTMNVLMCCLREKNRMIFTSSAAVKYSPHSCYAISKRTAENYILHYVEKKNLDARIMRFWNVYGPTQSLGYVIPDLMEKLYRDPEKIKIRGTGFDLRDFVYIDDVLKALWLAATKGEPGKIYEVGTGSQVTIRELAELIGEVINKKKPKVIPSKKLLAWERNEIPEDLEPIKKLGWKHEIELDEGIYRVYKERYLK